jgi:hypothetical protein
MAAKIGDISARKIMYEEAIMMKPENKVWHAA